MRVVLLTREYPPEVYGGAGVHVEYLATELAHRIDVEVRCMGPPRDATPLGPGGPRVRAFLPWEALRGPAPSAAVLETMSTDLAMAADIEDATLVHSHTWYANLAGHVSKLLHGLPHVVTSHSLEPLRPWKAEQIGPGGYALSSFCERTALEGADAVVAVSGAMRADILRCYPSVEPQRVRVIHNGVDPAEFRPDPGTEVLERYNVDPGRPSVVFVGRITRQKGIVHLLDAGTDLDPRAQLVLVASSPDTEEIGGEVAAKIAWLRERRDPGSVIWLDRILPRPEVVQLLSHATAFCCPSIYEPLGIVNLEAMACGAAVVATHTGGIPEVVGDGVTGYLVPYEAADSSGAPAHPDRFAADLAGRLNALVRDPVRARAFGEAGRARVLERFTWTAVAERTLALYEGLAA